ALPQAPLKKLFEKSFLRIFKNSQLFFGKIVVLSVVQKFLEVLKPFSQKGFRSPKTSVGALPQAPLKKLFEKSFLRILKNSQLFFSKIVVLSVVQKFLEVLKPFSQKGFRSPKAKGGRHAKTDTKFYITRAVRRLFAHFCAGAAGHTAKRILCR
ncbi:MAG: hypothetical protein IJW40_09285, partial [Clostridia bacterium]|nr:hypothetical protein [Clostridia bacterium]